MPNIHARNRDSNAVIKICVKHGEREITLKGREAFALHALIQSGPLGVTPIDDPAPRWSHYVFRLCGGGFNIETIDETHGGAFAGSHARYVLRSPVSILSVTRKLDRVAA